ncbi:hypothetical protein L6164_015968 [Bauhinia variegata]|uniref:Uncharacterized protein n=1 Tax=Bauhinia variegata TaxID=167791 RepID=A0ACB9NM84_BAUVA|nr:hypothetical protein L6164_015968 [Bauhinia variegata]
MENHSHSSHPNSRDSSPRYREVDNENPSWEEPPSNNSNSYKVKFMCSYGGKIQPRAHDNQLSYIGGDTKIIAFDRSVKFSAVMAKLSALCDSDVCLKYQLPGEDLDALISVSNDEDLEHMMAEYDRLSRGSKSARLRLFLFPYPSASTSFGSNEIKPGRQWFVDALNSLQIPLVEGSSPPAPVPVANPDYLFGLDKGYPEIPLTKFPDCAPAPAVPDVATKDLSAGSECGSEDRHAIGEQVLSSAEIQKQIQELQRLQLGNNELLQRKTDEGNGRIYTADYYSQKNTEKMAPPPAPAPMPGHPHAHGGPVPIPAPVSVPAQGTGFLAERHLTNTGFPLPAATATGTEQPVYLIQTPSGVFQATNLRPVTAPIGQPYYGVQRMVPSEVYNVPPPASLPHSHSQPKVGGYTEISGMVQSKVGASESGYTQMGYDSAGRQVYYAATVAQPAQYQMAPAGVDGRQGGGAMNQEGKVVTKVSSAV